MSNNLSFDWSEFSDPSSCLDLYGHVSRWGAADEPYSDNVVFRARALTDSFPLTSQQGMAIDGGASGDNGAQRSAFRARIEGANTPHSFLADPCDPAIASDLDYVYKLITMHTLFLSTKATHEFPVTRGDVVMVKLKRTNQSYDLQYGTFEQLVSIEDPTGNEGDFCSSLISLFGKIEHKPLPGSGVASVASVGATGGGSRAAGPCTATWSSRMARKYPTHVGGVHPDSMSNMSSFVTGESMSSPTDDGNFRITSPYGGRGDSHAAIDIGAPTGSPIYAIAAGKIIKIVTNCPAHSGAPCGPGQSRAAGQCHCAGGSGGKMGNQVKIQHTSKDPSGGTIISYYGHMQAVTAGLKLGDTVQAGQKIGTVGMTGNTNGAHIHLQVHMSGQTVDTLAYIYANTANGTKCATPSSGTTTTSTAPKCKDGEEHWPAGQYDDGTPYPAGCYPKPTV